jgi:hypothetical protein
MQPGVAYATPGRIPCGDDERPVGTKQQRYRWNKPRKWFEVRLMLHEHHAKKLARFGYCTDDDAIEHDRKRIAAGIIALVELMREER